MRNPQKALEYAKKAVALDRRPEPAHLDTLAEAYFVNEQFEEAVAAEQRALSLQPAHKFFQEQLKRFQQAREAKAAEIERRAER